MVFNKSSCARPDAARQDSKRDFTASCSRRRAHKFAPADPNVRARSSRADRDLRARPIVGSRVRRGAVHEPIATQVVTTARVSLRPHRPRRADDHDYACLDPTCAPPTTGHAGRSCSSTPSSCTVVLQVPAPDCVPATSTGKDIGRERETVSAFASRAIVSIHCVTYFVGGALARPFFALGSTDAVSWV